MKNSTTPTLLVLVGISGSGKSTWAKEHLNTNPGWVRVNRDDLRRQLVGELTQEYYKRSDLKSLEKHVTILQHEQIRHLLQHGLSVVVDNTHLNVSLIQEYFELFDHLADVELKFFKGRKNECKVRVSKREGIGTDVSYIDRQHAQYEHMLLALDVDRMKQCTSLYRTCRDLIYAARGTQPKAIIVDIDGTIANHMGVRDAYDGMSAGRDKPIQSTIDVIKAIKGNWLKRLLNPVTVIYLSGREDKCREVTYNWLRKHGLPWDGKLFMRETSDSRKDSRVKAELFLRNVADRYDVLGVFDDRLQVCQMWHKLGLHVFNVNQGLKHF